MLVDCGDNDCIYRMMFLDKQGDQICSIGNYVYDEWKTADISTDSGERLLGFEISLGGYDKNVVRGIRFVVLDLLGLMQ